MFPYAFAFQQLHDPLAVVPLHHHKQHVASGGQNGSHNENRIRAKPDPLGNGQEAQQDYRSMDQLCLTHGLYDFHPRM